jgi:transcriptional regulator with XRE-family HTH domain
MPPLETDSRPPPEAELIALARQARGLSPERAASQARIRISGRRWRQIEAGAERAGGKPAIARPELLAHMAAVAGVTPQQLEEVGKNAAALILREIHRQETEEAPDPVEQGIRAVPGLPSDEAERFINLRRAWHNRGPDQRASRNTA